MAYLPHINQRQQQTGNSVVLLLGIVALLVSAVAFTLAHLQSQPQQIEQQQQTKTDFAAAYLQHFLTTQLKQTETLAQSSLVTQKLNRVADRQQASKELSQALSNTHVKVLSGEDFQNNELSFTERDLLRQLRNRSSAHTFVAGTKAQLITAHTIGNRGALIVAVELAPWFQPLAKSINSNEGLQVADSDGANLWASGSRNQEAKTINTGGWRIQFYSDED